MRPLSVVIEKPDDWRSYQPSAQVLTARDYLSQVPERSREPHRVINLCRSYKYLSEGYYVTLLAEARGQRVLPSLKTINDLSRRTLYRVDLEAQEDSLDRLLNRMGERGESTLKFRSCFGRSAESELMPLARQLWELFPCPVLEVTLKRNGRWRLEGLRAAGIHELDDEGENLFADALDAFSRQVWRQPRKPKSYRYDLAMLVNPQEQMPPSNATALKKFEKAGRRAGLRVETIGPDDYGDVLEYDALFIRETTAIHHHTYRFARRAESDGLVVVDDSRSIARCSNKVFLANLFAANKVDAPRTRLVLKGDPEALEQAAAEIGFPLVVKIPDGSFSRGMSKVKTAGELPKVAAEHFEHSALLLLQEFVYTPHDWRIGVLDGKALYACQYQMSRGHWQIYQHHGSGKVSSGGHRTVDVEEAPKAVVDTAVRAAKLIGDGLYGVDLKEVDGRVLVVEVNDNPSIDAGVEDMVLGDALYDAIMQWFVAQLEKRHERVRGPA